MRMTLSIIGAFVLFIFLAIASFIAWNWNTIQNMRIAESVSVTDVAKFQPREAVKGCNAQPLLRYTGDNPLSDGTFGEMKAYSDSQGGVGLLVLVDGRIAAEEYRSDANEATRSFSFSLHKSVLALAYGVAIEDGIIRSIDDPIGLYLKEWATDPRGEIPLRAFLTMSSGLETLGQTGWQATKFNFSDSVTDTALTLKQKRAPFTQFHYKNTDSQLAGAALNRALKAQGIESYAAYLSDQIWCPIGAKDALLWPEREGGDPRFYAFLDASLRDWARVGLLVMQEGEFAGKQLVPSSWVKVMTSPSVSNPKYGLQTWIGSPYEAVRSYVPDRTMAVPQSEPYLADDVVFFDGFGGQRVFIVPSAGLVIVRSGEVSFTWDDGVLVNLALKDL